MLALVLWNKTKSARPGAFHGTMIRTTITDLVFSSLLAYQLMNQPLIFWNQDPVFFRPLLEE